MYNPSAHQLLKKILSHQKNDVGVGDFERRLVALFSGIFQRYEKLYGQHPKGEAAFSRLIEVMHKAYGNRPKALKNIDAQREANPAWFRSNQLTGMMLYVDRFNQDLKGLEDQLTYLEELGINYLHLMPLLKSPQKKNDGGYAVSDYRKIDPKFGTNADFQRLTKKLLDKNMLLMIDVVVNHTAEDHQWAKEAKAGNSNYQEYYYSYPDRAIPNLYEHGMPEVFPESAPGNFTFNEDMQQWVMTVFNNYQWDLNYTNPMVFVEMLDVILNLANMGVDVFRMDAVAFVWKKIGTSCQNLPEAHLIHQLFKLCTQVVAPGVAFLAEAIVAPQEIIKYFGESEVWSNEHDIAYNATLMALLWNSMATRSTRVMKAGMRDMPSKPNGTTWINYIRCHDDIGLGFEDKHVQESGFDPQAHRQFLTKFLTGDFNGSFAKGMPFMYNPKTGDARISGSLASLAGLEIALKEKNKLAIKRAISRINLLHGIILSYGGIPMIYSGDELGYLNDYSFLKEPDKADDNRWIHRPKMNWKLAEKRHKKNTPEQQIFSTLAHMIALRKNNKEFADDNNISLIETNNEHIFAYSRTTKDDETLVLANFKDDDQTVYAHLVFPQTQINAFKMMDQLTDKKIKPSDGRLTLEPYQILWLKNIE